MSGLSQEGLHRLLEHRSGSKRILKVNQVQLAKQLNVSRFALNRVIRAMVANGRLLELPSPAGPHSKTYGVTNPEEWQKRQEEYEDYEE